MKTEQLVIWENENGWDLALFLRKEDDSNAVIETITEISLTRVVPLEQIQEYSEEVVDQLSFKYGYRLEVPEEYQGNI